jgi:hypothetical protein
LHRLVILDSLSPLLFSRKKIRSYGELATIPDSSLEEMVKLARPGVVPGNAG